MSKEVMQRAYDIMNTVRWDVAEVVPHAVVMAFNDTLTALREALAEPQQFAPDWATYRQGFEDGKAEAIEAAQPAHEPVAYLWQHGETGRTRIVMPDQIITANANWSVVGPLYLSPPQRQPLTREQIIRSTDEISLNDPGCFIRIARAIEAAHGIKDQS